MPGVTTGTLRPDIAAIAVPATVDGQNMTGDDFRADRRMGALRHGWGGNARPRAGGRTRLHPRRTHCACRDATGRSPLHGQTTFDIYLNGNAYWRNVPAAVWRYKLGGYQVLKKWLSYRERGVLGRALRPEEVGYFAEVARRIGGIVAATNKRAG